MQIRLALFNLVAAIVIAADCRGEPPHWRLHHTASTSKGGTKAGSAGPAQSLSQADACNNDMTSVRCIALTTMLCLNGCASLAPEQFKAFVIADTQESELTYHGLHLQSGQLIVSDSGGADSLLLAIMSEEYSPYIHAGIVVLENNRAFVYEGFATIWPSLSGPPTDAMRGTIRRVPIDHYILRQRVTAIFDPPAHVNKKKVAAFAQARHRDGTRFDPYFDWRDHSQMYCTEFAALALHEGGAELVTPLAIRENPSLRIALDWLKISAPAIVSASSLTAGAQRVALISKQYTVEQLDAYFAAKRELHVRFTADQKLGNLWRWSWTGLRLRPKVAAFLKASRDQPQTSAAQLALEVLGPTESATVTAGR